jgi:hypothetical protein
MSDAHAVPEPQKRPLLWRNIRLVLVVVLAFFSIPVSLIVGFRFLHDFENMPLCGTQTFINVQNWYDYKRTNTLLNVDGRSTESLAKLLWFDAQDAKEWHEKYRYVPGLRKGDPGDLVMMYMKVPIRWDPSRCRTILSFCTVPMGAGAARLH